MNKRIKFLSFALLVTILAGLSTPMAVFAAGTTASPAEINRQVRTALASEADPPPPEPLNPYFQIEEAGSVNNNEISKVVIAGPPQPPEEYAIQRNTTSLPVPNQQAGINTLSNVPAFDWSHGCSATSAAMIAGYYDRTSFGNIYTGPTNGGVIPLDNSVWGTWIDSYGDERSLTPLSATKQGLDGRATKGHVDDYWWGYDNSDPDPFDGNWTEHTYGECLGDYMKTNQTSNYGNVDGSTIFYSYSYSGSPLTCSQMESEGFAQEDGTYGVKLFYESRGYTVTDCYTQKLSMFGGFTFEDYKDEIDAGYPVMFHVQGHTMVGVGYDDNNQTMYIHDTWDYNVHTMPWGGSYAGMDMYAVSIIHLEEMPGQCYALTIGHTGNGSDPTASPSNSTGCSTGQYVAGETITLSGAIPAAAWEINGWTGTNNNASTASSNTVTMPAGAHAASVTYTEIPPTCYTLTVGHTGSGNDPTASPANSTGCSTGQYLAGETITLSDATPDTGWEISGWSGTNNDASTANSNTVTMPASTHAASVTYTEIPPTCYALTVGHTGSGSDPATSPSNSTGCSAGQYLAGETITLSGASPASGWEINGWAGTNNNSSASSSNTVIMPASAHAASVIYTEIPPTCYPLTVGHTGSGSDPTASPSNSTGCSAGQYVAGETITLSGASPAAGWEIDGWSGTDNDSSISNSNTVSMPASGHSASVTYTEIPPTCYTLTIGHTGSGSDPTTSPSNSTGCSTSQYVAGETITLSGASPDTGWEIDSWSGTDNDSSTASSNTVTMPSSTHSASVTYTTLSGPETYEDSDSNISYTGNWTTWNTSSASSGSTRYSNDPTASATLTFSGRQVSLIFTRYLSRGDIEIVIDGGAPTILNQYGSSLSFQHRWDSPLMADGTHTIELRHPGGGHYIDLDALIVSSPVPPSPVEAGVYENEDSNIAYLGNWTVWNTASASGGSTRFCNDPTASAFLTFNGRQVSLVFTRYSSRGNVEISIDGGAPITLNQYGSLSFQNRWDSPLMAAGTHTIDLSHPGGSHYIDLDALIISNPESDPPASVSLSAVTGSSTGLVDLSWNAPGDDGNIGTATEYIIRYASSAIDSQSAWDTATDVSGEPIPQPAGTAQSMTVSGLVPGQTYYFALRTLDDSNNLSNLSNSPSAQAMAPTPVGVGTYEDDDPNITYTGNWTSWNATGPSGGSIHYTNQADATASLTFSGRQVSLLYTRYTSRGDIEITIDGGAPITLNQYGSLSYQNRWDSPLMADGIHTIELRHPGGTKYIDIDALIISSPTPPTPVGEGTYENEDPNIIYTGNWTVWNSPSTSGGSTHYSNDPSASATLTFTGKQVSLIFTRYTSRGNIEISIDGGAPIMLNQYSGSLSYQNRWDSPLLVDGTHTIELRHPGGSHYIDLDALIISSPEPDPPVGEGTYENEDSNISYTGNWTVWNTTSASGGSTRYSNDTSASAILTFTGSQVSLIFTRYSSRGEIEVIIDGGAPVTLNQYGSVLSFQNRWDSPLLTAGTHTIELRHPGGGHYIDLDAIEVFDP